MSNRVEEFKKLICPWSDEEIQRCLEIIEETGLGDEQKTPSNLLRFIWDSDDVYITDWDGDFQLTCYVVLEIARVVNSDIKKNFNHYFSELDIYDADGKMKVELNKSDIDQLKLFMLARRVNKTWKKPTLWFFKQIGVEV